LAQNCGVNVIRTMTALQGKVRIFAVTAVDGSFSDYVSHWVFLEYSMQMEKMHGLA